MAQIDIDKFVISLRRCFGENKGIATRLDSCLFSLGLKYVDTPTGGRLERVDQPTMLEKIMWGSGEKKPAEWSDDDEEYLKAAIWYAENPAHKVVKNSMLVEWLKSLKGRFGSEANCTTTKEWSEEDEGRYLSCLKRLSTGNIEQPENVNTVWFKSLKNRVQPQPKQEWSEKDEKMLKWLCRIVHSQRVGKVITLREESVLGEWIDKWLNHNPQPHWKPSDEQLNSLYDVLNPCDGFSRGNLESLYQDLKKLKE